MAEPAEKLDGVKELLRRQLRLTHPDHGELDAAFFTINWSPADKAYIVACHSSKGPIFTSLVHSPTLMAKVNRIMQEESLDAMSNVPARMM